MALASRPSPDHEIHLLVPMSGQGVRYQAAGYTEPKPLIPVSGRPMIERLLEVFPERWKTVFIMADNHLQTKLPETLKRLRPDATQLAVTAHKFGPSWALLKGLEQVPDAAPVLVSYCDYGMVWDPLQFERFVATSGCDGCLVSYRGFHAHYLSPVTYAYSRLDGERVVEIKEKGSFTANREAEFASCGAYYFRTAWQLRQAIEQQIASQHQLNGEYYTSLTMDSLLRLKPEGTDVRVFEIPGFFQWGTPEDLQIFEYWERTYAAYNRAARQRAEVDQVLMPMAGLGSRFRGLSAKAKPFIPVAGTLMYRRALDSLPKAAKTVVVALDSCRSDLAADPQLSPVWLEKTPPGQALSTAAGLGSLQAKGDIIVSSCDHAIVLDAAVFRRFRAAPDASAAIFTVRGFPGTRRSPEAFAYVEVEQSGAFPLVRSVAVKKPLSAQPAGDHLLVGTFWFASVAILTAGIAALQAAGQTVNGELYLDSVFTHLQALGHKVRVIPLDGYINYGDPASLAEALYWHDIFTGHVAQPRAKLPGLSHA